MKLLGDQSLPQLRQALAQDGLTLRTTPFVLRLKSDLPRVAEDLLLLYPWVELGRPDDFADFHLEVLRETGLRRWLRPEARFYADGDPAFSTLPVDQAFHMVEWGLNWAVTSLAHQFVVYHAAALERHGRALLLPAPPGSGKSTLTAALSHRGWRLLSDELSLLDPGTRQVVGMARPVNLKNAAIDVIRRFVPEAVLTTPVPDTLKGTLALMRAPQNAVDRVGEPARPAWIISPRYEAGSPTRLSPTDKAYMLLLLAEQAFNYDIHGRAGFEMTADLVDNCDCFELVYADLDDAIARLDALVQRAAGS
jgi:HprK-related kinase A